MSNNLKGTVNNPDVIYGKSAYEIAVMHGFEGTEEEWVNFTSAEANRAEKAAHEAAEKAADEVTRLVGEIGIVQETGDSETSVMSQKATTEALKQTAEDVIGRYEETLIEYKNLLPVIDVSGYNNTQVGISIAVDEDGVFTINGTSTDKTSFEITPNGEVFGTLKKGVRYKILFKWLSGSVPSLPNGGYVQCYLFVNSYNAFGSMIQLFQGSTQNAYEFTVAEDTPLQRFAINIAQIGLTLDNVKCIPYLIPADEYDETYQGGAGVIQFNISNLDKAYEIEKVIDDVLVKNFSDEAEKVTAETLTTGLEADLSFLAFADPHSIEENKYLKYAELMRNGGIDFMIGLGDYLPYKHYTRAEAITSTAKVLSLSGKNNNCFYALGNHDMNFDGRTLSLDTTLSKKEQHKLLCSHLNGSVHFNDLDPYGCYYYSDFEAAKIRIIVLNTSDLHNGNGGVGGTSYGKAINMRQTQLNWLAEKALNFQDKANRAEWSVIVFAHTDCIIPNFPQMRLLKAFKEGTVINMTFQDGDNTLSLNADYTAQGAIDVIGHFYGHAHRDKTGINNGITDIQFRADNASLDDVYKAEINGATAGGYYITAKNGKKFGFTLATGYPNARYVMYNEYLTDAHTEAALLDENGVSIVYLEPKTSDYVEGMTEIATGFVAMRKEGTATTESCAVVNINKNTRTISIVPFGIGERRIISY